MNKYEFCFKNLKTGKVESYVFEIDEEWELEAIEDAFMSSGFYKLVFVEVLI